MARRRNLASPVDLLHDSLLQQVLHVLQDHIALGHHDGIRAHVLEVLGASGPNSGWQAIRIVCCLINIDLSAVN